MALKRPYQAAATICALILTSLGSGPLATEKPLLWKPSEDAMLRVDDRPVAQWSVYQEAKKIDPLIVQMNNRYLLIDQRLRRIFELDPKTIVRKGADIYWDPSDHPAKPLDTSEWLVRDVGAAYKISAKLIAENKVVDVQIPHPLDLRSIH